MIHHKLDKLDIKKSISLNNLNDNNNNNKPNNDELYFYNIESTDRTI